MIGPRDKALAQNVHTLKIFLQNDLAEVSTKADTMLYRTRAKTSNSILNQGYNPFHLVIVNYRIAIVLTELTDAQFY